MAWLADEIALSAEHKIPEGEIHDPPAVVVDTLVKVSSPVTGKYTYAFCHRKHDIDLLNTATKHDIDSLNTAKNMTSIL